MSVFEYAALNKNGKNLTGIIDADSPQNAKSKLRNQGIFPTSIKETRDFIRKKEDNTIIKSSYRRVKAYELAMTTRQLATLIGAHFPLVNAIDTLIPQTKSKHFKKILAQIKNSIVEGSSFAGALSSYPSIFSQLFINMVKAGESSGTLEIVLERLADIMEKQEALKNRIKAALTYPILMAILGTVVLFLLLTFIIPNITSIFTDMKKVLPAPTRFLIGTSHFVKSYWWLIVLCIASIILTINQIKKTENGRYFFDKRKLSFPIVGEIITKLSTARLSRTLGSLLENGVTMLLALGIVQNIVENVLIKQAVEKAVVDVGKGHELGKSLASSNIFPHLAVQMIQVGETTGDLEKMLTKIADIYETEVESSILSLTSLLEPLMILCMGVVTGFIVLSICLPIFEMNQLVK
ncbi:MAG: type II secretion system inner membrane protein GspF [Desulfobacterales bacterium]|nr:type II secretion system inner membrane protein GspF [Desulfobacterales bacterium]